MERLTAVEKGRQVALTLDDGRIVKGKFAGLEPMADAAYSRRWEETRAMLGPETRLPALGERVLTNQGRIPEAAFEGVDPGKVWLRLEGRSELEPLAADAVVSVGQGEDRLAGSALLRLLHEGRLPARSQVAVSLSRHERALVAPEQVLRVTLTPARHGKVTGALVGLAADALVVALALHSLSESWNWDAPVCPEGTSCTSCPLVYSFDGRAWRLDSEVFGAAIFERAQRTDRAVLEHLAESDGRYRLQLRDEMDEIQWLDAARLVVVDHPRGTRVVPAFDGSLHLLGPAAQAPAVVRDLRGRDVRALVAGRDASAWVSDALAVAPELRDGLEFELRRPAGARAVTLAFRARSTPWADAGKVRLMALLGDGVEAWRERMERDDAARAEFLAALRREGLLTLRAWDGARWREVTALANLATVVERELAVRVDLAGLPGDRLRFRLDATPGLWSVNAVVAEFDAALASHPTLLAPLVARTTGGQDLREQLAAADGRRFAMQPHRGQVDLEFAAPPLEPGTERTLALEATGHYVTLSRAHGPARQEEFDRLVREPGAFARFNLELQREAAAQPADGGGARGR